MRRLRTVSGASKLAEFAPALMILFIMTFVLINMIGLGAGMVALQLIARQAAFKAATAGGLMQAETNMALESRALISSGFGKFGHLAAVGGYSGSGSDLFFDITDINSKAVQVVGPNQPITSPIDSSHVYEASVVLTCDVGPFLSCAGVPFLRNIPALSAPARIASNWHMALEDPNRVSGNGGANGNSNNGNGGNGSVIGGTKGNGSSGPLVPFQYPPLGFFSAMPGQGNIVGMVTMDVPALGNPNPTAATGNWTDTGLSVGTNQRISIAYNSDMSFVSKGYWSNLPAVPFYTANGALQQYNQFTVDGLNKGSLVGRVGGTAPPETATATATNGSFQWPSSPNEFLVGTNFYNFSTPDTGELYLRMNDDYYADNRGKQHVTVWITQP